MVDSGPATSLPAPVAPLSRPGTYFGRVIVFLILCGSQWLSCKSVSSRRFLQIPCSTR